MRVVIGKEMDENTFDADRVPIAIVLSDADKRNIANMAPDATIYASFPDDYDRDHISAWLKLINEGRAVAGLSGPPIVREPE